jgi:steroid delta-isomerase-like uncharacterized protein
VTATPDNKAIARRFWEEIWNGGDMAAADEIIAPEFDFYLPVAPEPFHGPDSIKKFVAADRVSFPDLHFTIEEQVGEGDSVATRWIMRGTHLGQWATYPPSGKQIHFEGITIFRIRDGQIVSGRAISDALGLVRQLGS